MTIAAKKRPVKLGTEVDKLYKLQEEIDKYAAERKTAEAKEAAAKKRYNEAQLALQQTFSDDDLAGAAGKVATAELKETKVPTVKAEDWPRVWAFITRNKAYDLMQRRIAPKAWEDRVAARSGKPIPGISKFTVKKIIVKRRKK